MPDADEKRICKYSRCNVDISERHFNALYCCDDHKRAEDRERNGRWVREPRVSTHNDHGPARTDSRRLRRANRDGSGTRIYVVGEEVDKILALLDADAGSESLKKKARAARRRCR